MDTIKTYVQEFKNGNNFIKAVNYTRKRTNTIETEKFDNAYTCVHYINGRIKSMNLYILTNNNNKNEIINSIKKAYNDRGYSLI